MSRRAKKWLIITGFSVAGFLFGFFILGKLL